VRRQTWSCAILLTPRAREPIIEFEAAFLPERPFINIRLTPTGAFVIFRTLKESIPRRNLDEEVCFRAGRPRRHGVLRFRDPERTGRGASPSSPPPSSSRHVISETTQDGWPLQRGHFLFKGEALRSRAMHLPPLSGAIMRGMMQRQEWFEMARTARAGVIAVAIALLGGMDASHRGTGRSRHGPRVCRPRTARRRTPAPGVTATTATSSRRRTSARSC
jgi:hypothetical protein